MKAFAIRGLAAAACALCAMTAQAGESPWMVRVGVHNVDPGSDSSTAVGKVGVDSAASLTLNLDYAFTPNLVLDVLGAYPFKHDITLEGVGKIGSTSDLPPTVTLQYHFLPQGKFDPFVGVGFNYTTFFDSDTNSKVGNAKLDLDDSFGYAVQAGVDTKLMDNWVLGVDVRYIDIDTDAKVGGTKIGTVNIDPIAYGVNLGYRF